MLQQYPGTGTAGADITTANSGATLVAGQAAGQNLAQFNATDGIRFTTVTTGNANGSLARWAFDSNGASAVGAISMLFRTPTSTAVDRIVGELRSDAGRVWQFKWLGTSPNGYNGNFVVVGSGNEYNYILGSNTSTLSPNTVYRIELQFANTATASLKTQVYNTSNVKLADTTTAPTGSTDPITYLTLGLLGNTSNDSVGFRSIQLNSGATTAIGPYASAPTITVDPHFNQAYLNTLVSGGTPPFTYSINPSPATGTSQPIEGDFLLAQSSSAVTYTLTVTDANGFTASTTTTVPATATGTSTTISSLTERVVYKNGQWV